MSSSSSELPTPNNVSELIEQVSLLNNDALLMINKKEYDSAYNVLKHAELQWFQFNKYISNTYQQHCLIVCLTDIYNNLSILYSNINDHNNAYNCIKYTYNIACYYNNINNHKCNDINILLNYSTVLCNRGNKRDALQYTQHALHHALLQYKQYNNNNNTTDNSINSNNNKKQLELLQIIIGCYHNIGVIYEYLTKQQASKTAYNNAKKYSDLLNTLKNNDNNNNNISNDVYKAIKKLIEADLINVHSNSKANKNLPMITTHNTTGNNKRIVYGIDNVYNDVLFSSIVPLPISVHSKIFTQTVIKPSQCHSKPAPMSSIHSSAHAQYREIIQQLPIQQQHQQSDRPHTTQALTALQYHNNRTKRSSSVVEQIIQKNASNIHDLYINSTDNGIDIDDTQQQQYNENIRHTLAMKQYLSNNVLHGISNLKLMSPKTNVRHMYSTLKRDNTQRQQHPQHNNYAYTQPITDYNYNNNHNAINYNYHNNVASYANNNYQYNNNIQPNTLPMRPLTASSIHSIHSNKSPIMFNRAVSANSQQQANNIRPLSVLSPSKPKVAELVIGGDYPF